MKTANKYGGDTPILGIIFFSFTCISPWIDDYFREESFHPVFGYLCLSSLFLLYYAIWGNERVRIEVVDLSVISFACYQLLSLIWTESITLLTICECSLWFFLYITVRCFLVLHPKNRRYGIMAIIISGLFQSIIALLQMSGVLQSNHCYFDMTGNFANPGPFGGYLALSGNLAIAMLYFYWHELKSFLRVSGIISVLFLIIMCFYSDSRAAWIAIFIPTCWLLMKCKHLKRTKSIAIPLFLFFAISIWGLYSYRKDSVDGRLLIWKISTNMIQEKPFSGWGISAFQTNYMKFQQNYFEEFPYTEKEALLASDNVFAFNEIIRILCEYGIVGFILLLGIIWGLLRCYPYFNRISNVAFCGLISYSCFSCFSYPNSVFPFKIVLPLLLAIAASSVKTGKRMPLNKKERTATICFILLLNIYVVKEWAYLNNIEKTLLHFYGFEDDIEKEKLHEEYDNYSNYSLLVTKVGNVFFEKGFYNEAIPILHQSLKLYPRGQGCIDLGYAYLYTRDTTAAKHQFLLASYMLPAFITPVYNLFSIYKDCHQTDSAYFYARKIITMPIKKEASYTKSVQEEAQEYSKTIY